MLSFSGKRVVRGGVLPFAPVHHDIRLLPSGYFAPHTRGFDWARHHIAL
jgi:hypothetical protein